ncbi:MAG TPA: hypothetical protein VMF69_02065 [Gemmataceae bacterium]|nr:hypothetical protein [Gemmataceae bacterium]
MRRSWQYGLLCAPFVVLAFLTIPFGQRRAAPVAEALPLDHWDIPELAAYLNEAGLELNSQPVRKDGDLSQSVFFTSTKKDWYELNRLFKDPKRIHEWRGTVYCSREPPKAAAHLAQQWGNNGLLAGPFVFFGDAELLARIDAALKRPAPEKAP